MLIAPSINKEGILELLLHISNANFLKSEKGESTAIHLILLSVGAYNNVVAAPIDLPQIPILPTPGILSRKSTTFLTSCFSWYPNDIYFPSLNPEPAKSKAHKLILCLSKHIFILLLKP